MYDGELTIRDLRKRITVLEFEMMDGEHCEECVKMLAVHLAVAVINGFELKDYQDHALRHPLSVSSPARQDRNAGASVDFRHVGSGGIADAGHSGTVQSASMDC